MKSNENQEENRYSRGKIYKIIDNTNNNVYIGSTCEKYLSNRLAQHVKDYKKFLNNSNASYTSSYEIIKNNNYEIVLIESVPCNSKDELLMREKHYINLYKNDEMVIVVNKYRPLTTKEERKLIKKQVSQKALKDKYNCICGSIYSRQGKSRHFKTKKHINYCQTISI